ncbi:NAD-dependent epimerase/dehydratase family protein, partial [uncultured Thiodictyon sp.]|uniref:NAD-dependent epimerase/dehydratase family protein n=1 Tax=uncultured Thiodictyon sp. TaxID=1846217 RepID=UPI0025DFA277
MSAAENRKRPGVRAAARHAVRCGMLAGALFAGLAAWAADPAGSITETPLAPHPFPRGKTMFVQLAPEATVGESVAKPLTYYDNNVVGTVRLLEAMVECDVKTLVFSSSATVYGDPQRLPLTEDHPVSATNPYGQTKLVIEGMLRDLFQSDATWRLGLLRYFNPVGA